MIIYDDEEILLGRDTKFGKAVRALVTGGFSLVTEKKRDQAAEIAKQQALAKRETKAAALQETEKAFAETAKTASQYKNYAIIAAALVGVALILKPKQKMANTRSIVGGAK